MKDTLLSPNFSLCELTRSENRLYQKQNRALAQKFILPLSVLANYLLEPARFALACPLVVTCALRCPAQNESVGGAKTSQHLLGQAADFIPRCCLGAHARISLKEAYEVLRQNKFLHYGQLILEEGWLHISLGAPFRPLSKCGQSFEIKGGKKTSCENTEAKI